MNDDVKTIQVPAHMIRASALADGGLSLGFHTNELTSDEKIIAMKHFQKFGMLLFRESEQLWKEEEIPKVDDVYDEQKSPAQRLRGVIFILSQQKNVPKEKFNEFYRLQMEKIIEFMKSKLD